MLADFLRHLHITQIPILTGEFSFMLLPVVTMVLADPTPSHSNGFSDFGASHVGARGEMGRHRATVVSALPGAFAADGADPLGRKQLKGARVGQETRGLQRDHGCLAP